MAFCCFSGGRARAKEEPRARARAEEEPRAEEEEELRAREGEEELLALARQPVGASAGAPEGEEERRARAEEPAGAPEGEEERRARAEEEKWPAEKEQTAEEEKWRAENESREKEQRPELQSRRAEEEARRAEGKETLSTRKQRAEEETGEKDVCKESGNEDDRKEAARSDPDPFDPSLQRDHSNINAASIEAVKEDALLNASLPPEVLDSHAASSSSFPSVSDDVKKKTQTVGIDSSVVEVIDLLEPESKNNAVAVILQSPGGMGKTTLADAVFSQIKLQGSKYARIKVLESIDSTPKIIMLQKSILTYIMEPEEPIPDIRKYEDGQRELSLVLQKVPAFIYIDNVMCPNDLQFLLPKDMKKAKKLRLLLTTHDINVGRACRMKTKVYSNFSDKEAVF